MFSRIDECWFQGSLAVGFAALATVWGRSFVLGGLTRNSLWSSLEGVFPALLLRLLLAASMAGMSIYAFKPEWMNWSCVPLPTFVRLSGVPLEAFGIFLLVWAHKSLGAHFCPTLQLKQEHILVTTGPYRWIRHPMYSSFVLLWVAYFLLSANWFIGLTGLLAEGIIIVARTPREEQMMVERFGGHYVQYTRRAGRFLPRWAFWERRTQKGCGDGRSSLE
jgi:protein-S-isoprenylcysteine O-methyltransferase Ste14